MTREEIVNAIVRQMLKEAGAPPTAGAVTRGFTVQLARDIVASGVLYLLVENDSAIMCLSCGAISHNPNDVHQLYCGACHQFLAPWR